MADVTVLGERIANRMVNESARRASASGDDEVVVLQALIDKIKAEIAATGIAVTF